MIVKSLLGGVSASIDLTISGVAVNYTSVSMLTLEVGEDLHDYACVELGGIPTRAITDYYGASVRFKVSTGGRYTHEFLGTIEQVEPLSKSRDGTVNDSPFQYAKLHCFGLSYRMRGKVNKSWDGMSLTDIAKKLAYKHGFSIDVPKTKLVFPRTLQSSESDWALLVRCANRQGYRVNVHGTHMHVYSPHNALSRTRSFHKLGTYASSGIDNVPGKILEMKGHFGRDAKDGVYMDTVVPVLTATGTQFDVRASDVLRTSGGQYEHRLDDIVDSLSEARAVVAAESINCYDFTADVKAMGVAGAFPGGVVDLDKYRGNFDGYWYVRSVKHTINTSAFYTDLEISRNAGKQLTRTTTAAYTSPPPPALKADRWEASRKTVREYV